MLWCFETQRLVTCVVEGLDGSLGHVYDAVHLEHPHVLLVQGDVPPEGHWRREGGSTRQLNGGGARRGRPAASCTASTGLQAVPFSQDERAILNAVQSTC